MYSPATRKFTAWGALISLACLPVAWAQDHTASTANNATAGVVIGQIVSASGATLNGVVARAGGTLTSGSTLETAERGTALVKLSADTQATLRQKTSVNFQEKSGRVVAEVISGTITARAPSKNALVLETPRYTIEPAGAGPAIYGTAMCGGINTEVAARRGPVALTEKTSGTRFFVLKEGQCALVVTSTEALSRQAQGGTPAPLCLCQVFPPGLLFAGSVVAGTGIALAIEQLVPEPFAAGGSGGASGGSSGGGANPSISSSSP
jgi:hypothetical protein